MWKKLDGLKFVAPKGFVCTQDICSQLTGHSPYEIVFGRSPKQLIDLQIPQVQPDFTQAPTSSYFSALKETVKNAHYDACDQLRTAQHHQKSITINR